MLAFDTFPYHPSFRKAIFDLFRAETSRVDDICHMNFAIGGVFADALIRLAVRSRIGLDTVDLIGSHGQTIFHNPAGRKIPGGGKIIRSTLQIGEPSVIAQRTGITTVADFRPRNVAAGGQGAPLVPFADYFLFRHKTRSRAIQNIGGIANVTYLPAGGDVSSVVAFDTGPGNMMIDRVTELMTGGKANFDIDGKIARKGKVIKPLLAKLMKHPFLRRRPPKTTGREEFGSQLTDGIYLEAIGLGLDGQDVLATVTAFTAASIAQAYKRFLGPVDEVILCGGGAWNNCLVDELTRRLAPARIRPISDFGIDPDAKEALSFAILARQTIAGLANNIPSATGASCPVVCGKIVPGRLT